VDATATEVTLVHGAPLLVLGDPRAVEAAILAAARGSIPELVWLTEVGRDGPVALNPDHVVALRPASGDDRA
jgi:hypothetical protein